MTTHVISFGCRRRPRGTRLPCPSPGTPGVQEAEELDDLGDQAGPAGLVAGARARRRCRRGSTRRTGGGRASAGRSGTSRCRRRPAAGRARRAGRCASSRSAISLATSKRFIIVARAGRALDLEVVAVVEVELQQRPDDQRVDRHPDRPAPVGVAAEHAGVRLGRQVVDAVLLAADVEDVRVLARGTCESERMP